MGWYPSRPVDGLGSKSGLVINLAGENNGAQPRTEKRWQELRVKPDILL